MTYADGPTSKLVDAHCAVCARPLTDAVSIELGIGPVCRADHGFDNEVEPAIRAEANKLVYFIATSRDRDAIIDACNQLHDLGFKELADRIERRIRGGYQPSPPAPEPKLTSPPVLTLVAPEQASDLPEAARAPLPFKLTDGQDQALAGVGRLLKKKDPSVLFVVGFAGVGKTTALRVIAQQFGRPVVITPTGKAALRVTEATGLAARTIHRWIYRPVEDPRTGAISFVRRAPDEIDAPPSRLVLLDEASMVGPDMWRDIWEVCTIKNLRLVCVGDGFQLPPVMPGKSAPFSILTPEFADQLKGERVELTEVLRQAQGSPVIRASMALRAGHGVAAFAELPRIQAQQIASVAVSTFQQGGIVICHRNVTRFRINNGMRLAFGITDPLPQPNEPLLVLKNNYAAGAMNGEATNFLGWHTPPDGQEKIYDRWLKKSEETRFGAILFGGKTLVTVSIEEIHGKLECGLGAISIGAERYARANQLYLNDVVAPHLHANFGYAYTAHKSQGSQWPYVFVVVEPSVRLNEELGRRWAYTAITRASEMAAIFLGSL